MVQFERGQIHIVVGLRVRRTEVGGQAKNDDVEYLATDRQDTPTDVRMILCTYDT